MKDSGLLACYNVLLGKTLLPLKKNAVSSGVKKNIFLGGTVWISDDKGTSIL